MTVFTASVEKQRCVLRHVARGDDLGLVAGDAPCERMKRAAGGGYANQLMPNALGLRVAAGARYAVDAETLAA